MYAIVELGSSQYKISEGDTIAAPLMEGKEGKSVTLDKVLLVEDGKTVRVGQPYLKDVTIKAKITGHDLEKKKISFKYRRRKNSKWKKGHRQQYTSLNISEIAAGK
jgi:large subunit ribosomal protein L21